MTGIVRTIAERLHVGPELGTARLAGFLQVPDSRGWGRVVSAGVRVMRMFERAEDDSVLARKVLDKATQLLLNVNVRQLTNGQSTALDIPKELADSWSIPRQPRHP